MNPIYGPLAAATSSLTWALGSSTYSRLTREYPPAAVNLTRALVGIPLFLAFACLFGDFRHDFSVIRLWHLGWLLLSMVSSYGIGDLCFFLSTRALGVPGALAIASSYPVFTVVLELFEGHVPTRAQLVGVLLVVLGVVAVILSGGYKAALFEKQKKVGTLDRVEVGVALALITAVFWSLNTYSVGHAGSDLTPAVANTIRMIWACLITTTILRFTAPHRPWLVSSQSFKKTAPIFVLEVFVGSMSYVYGLTHSPIVVASALTSLAPVMAVPIALVMRLERFSWKRSAGVVLVVAGLCFLF